MSRLKFDAISEETIQSPKVVRGPKTVEVLLGLTDNMEPINKDFNINREENLNTAEEIRERNAREMMENIKIQLINAMEEADEQSTETRINGLSKIRDILIHHYIPEIVANRKITLAEMVEKSIRHGKGTEQSVAANILLLLLIQLGEQFDGIKSARQYIVKAMSDETIDFSERAECCSVLGVLYFLQNEEFDDLIDVISVFENIFFNIGNKTAVTDKQSVLESAAIFSWGLLFTKIPLQNNIALTKKLTTITKYLAKVLESSHLNMRIAAGETLAVILEFSRTTNSTELTESIEQLEDITKFLSYDYQKFRHKTELKTQRATFRDISRYIEKNIQPEIMVEFGIEAIVIKSWALHQQYIGMLSAIGPGIVTHLINNPYIRDVIDVDECRIPLLDKSEKRIMHDASSKERTLERRDDRRYKYEGLVTVE